MAFLLQSQFFVYLSLDKSFKSSVLLGESLYSLFLLLSGGGKKSFTEKKFTCIYLTVFYNLL